MSDFSAIMHDVLPSLKALLMYRDVACRTWTRETPQIEYNAKKPPFFSLGATGNQKLNITQHHPITTTKEPGMSEQEQSSKAQDIPQLCSMPVRHIPQGTGSMRASSCSEWPATQKIWQKLRKSSEKLEPPRLWRNWSMHFCSGTSERGNRPWKTARVLTLLEARRQDKLLASPSPWWCVLQPWGSPLGPAEEKSSPDPWQQSWHVPKSHLGTRPHNKPQKQKLILLFFLPVLLDVVILHYFNIAARIWNIF